MIGFLKPVFQLRFSFLLLLLVFLFLPLHSVELNWKLEQDTKASLSADAPILNIVSLPQGAEVYTPENKLLGITPLNLTLSEPQLTSLFIRKLGYEETSIPLASLSLGLWTLKVELKKTQAQLVLQGRALDWEVWVNREKQQGEIINVTPGPIALILRRFGYQDWVQKGDLKVGEIWEITPNWLPSEPEPLTLSLRPNPLNPHNPGQKGRLNLTVETNRPLFAHFQVIDEAGTILWEETEVRLEQRQIQFSWDFHFLPLDKNQTLTFVGIFQGTQEASFEQRIPLAINFDSKLALFGRGSHGFGLGPLSSPSPIPPQYLSLDLSGFGALSGFQSLAVGIRGATLWNGDFWGAGALSLTPEGELSYGDFRGGYSHKLAPWGALWTGMSWSTLDKLPSPWLGTTWAWSLGSLELWGGAWLQGLGKSEPDLGGGFGLAFAWQEGSYAFGLAGGLWEKEGIWGNPGKPLPWFLHTEVGYMLAMTNLQLGLGVSTLGDPSAWMQNLKFIVNLVSFQ